MKIQTHIHNLDNYTFNVIFWLCMIVVLWFMLQIVVFATFRIPSRSMEPELKISDHVLVLKPIIGPRLFNIYASIRNEQTEIYRIPGFRKIKRNDVLVFNYPYPKNRNKIEMHILKYYIKRCIGLPGDTLFIRNGFFHVLGVQTTLGNIESQKKIEAIKRPEDKVFFSFPFDSIIGWNIKDFGPFYIPGKGDSIILNRTNFQLYKNLIEWEQQEILQYKNNVFLLGDKQIQSYLFRKNYYFMAGDNGLDSQDSRYWGLVPEEYIVGKAWLIWKSYDPFTGKFRWERFLKKIH